MELALPEHLTKEEKRQVKEIIRKVKKSDGIPRTAQESILLKQNEIIRIGNLGVDQRIISIRMFVMDMSCRI